MKFVISAALLVASLSAFATHTSTAVLEETLYYDFQKTILKGESQQGLTGFTPYEQSLYVDALWDLTEENSPEALKMLQVEEPVYYELLEKLRLGILRLKYKRAKTLPEDVVVEIKNALAAPEAEVKIIYTLAAYEEDLTAAGHTDLIDLAKQNPRFADIKDEEVRKEYAENLAADLVNKNPDVTTYMNGEYFQSVKLFLFCRANRLYPCLMIMKNVHGELVREEKGDLWFHRALASSKKGLPSYSKNGNTPAGVFTIDSVMPSADQQVSFGKFRRMILNFIPKSRKEVLFKSLLPDSSQDRDWWKSAVVARDIGRNLFRIHGTGKINEDAETPYYPFVRTSGCVAQRENTYDGVEFKDQRALLDTIMKAMDLEPIYENELKIKGILYVHEIDDKDAPVTLEDLRKKGIE
jgi:hypothetical protein